MEVADFKVIISRIAVEYPLGRVGWAQWLTVNRFYLKVPPRDLPGLGKSRELQVIRHSGGSRNPGKSLDPGFRRGDGPWNLAPGFSCPVVTDRDLKVREIDWKRGVSYSLRRGFPTRASWHGGEESR